jgi:Sjoegren syndrome nuclear autoantigen 1
MNCLHTPDRVVVVVAAAFCVRAARMCGRARVLHGAKKLAFHPHPSPAFPPHPPPPKPKKGIEDLREKREGMLKQIADEEAEKARVSTELQQLTRRLGAINESLARKLDAKAEYDKVIAETEAAYMKLLESSQTLLSVLKRESVSMAKRAGRAS